MTELPVAFEISSLALLVLILVADLLLVLKRPHIPAMREATAWVVFYAVLALSFAGVLWLVGDQQHSVEFVAGWLTEYSLSIDNLFVFVLLMSRFKVPRSMQQEVLMLGILIALALRGIFIALGSVLIEQFTWVFFIFGAWLLWTAIKQVRESQNDEVEETEAAENFMIRLLRRRVKITDDFHDMKFRVDVVDPSSKATYRAWTPLLLVLIALGSTDLLFALDSIPAIFGITQSAFIVFSANLFALMGLRQLYFLLGGLLDKLPYLHYGIAAILAFIGVKLIFHALHENSLPFLNSGQPIHWAPDISTGASLVFITVAMVIATIASLIKVHRDTK